MNNEIVTKNVGSHIALADSELYISSKKQGYTIYGDIANYIESKTDVFDTISEHLSTYLQYKNYGRLKEEFEENSSLYERYIKNDPLKVELFNQKSEIENTLIAWGVNIATHGPAKLTSMFLQMLDKKKVRDAIWQLTAHYAQSICKNNVTNYPMISIQLCNTYNQLYRKMELDVSDKIVQHKKIKKVPVFFQEPINHTLALCTYRILYAKHNDFSKESEKNEDLRQLLQLWNLIGISGKAAEDMFKTFDNMCSIRLPDDIRVNTTVQQIFYNLMTELSRSGKISKEKAREVNSKLLDYVPNSRRQRAVATGGKLIAKTAILAGTTAGGVLTENPQLLNTAGKTATSLFKDLSNTELIGNILKESGIDEKDIRGCIEGARKEQKKLDSLVD